MGNTAEGSPSGSAVKASALPLALLPGALFALLLFGLLTTPLPWHYQWTWIAALDIRPALRIDGLAAQFLLLITGIGTLVFVYAAGYLADDHRRWRVFTLLTLFMLAMIGAVSSDHLILLFVFWELTSVLSFLLVGFDHESEASRRSAKQAMLVTGSGGLALLAGIILLADLAGSYSLQTIIAVAPTLFNDTRLPVALTLIFIGAFSKSAQFPFHFWLPNAMAAPTPVSAYLHSATLVKLGIYLLARLDAGFSELPFWEYTLLGIGTLTAVLAATQTIRERDLKRILAWSTVASLGTLTLLIGLPGDGAAMAVASLFFAHALYKAPLFFVAGNLDHGAGTRNIDELTGMRRYMPWTAAAAMLAALSMAGLPLSLGFVAKDLIKVAKAEAGVFALVSHASLIVNAIAVAVAAIAAIHIFWGRDTVPRQVHPHEAPLTMLVPPLLLVGLGLLFGVQPTLVDPLLGAAAQAMAAGIDPSALGTAYETRDVVEASLVALGLGLAVYFSWDWLHVWQKQYDYLDELGAERAYWRLLKGMPRIAVEVTRRLQHGALSRYLLTAVGATTLMLLGLLWAATIGNDPAQAMPTLPDFALPPLPIMGAVLLIAAGALAALVVRAPLLLLLVSGLVGYGSAILFLFSGAPDLAFTQFAVETIFVVVAAAVLRRMRADKALDPVAASAGQAAQAPDEGFRPLALLVSIVFGALLTLLVLQVNGVPFDTTVSDFFAAQSLPAAYGRNVVNVIIVDFRALDTLGEIAVLAFALLAALPLLKLARQTGRRLTP